jgi:hypothetical protein
LFSLFFLSLFFSLSLSLISGTPSTDLVSGNVKPSCHRAAKRSHLHPWRLKSYDLRRTCWYLKYRTVATRTDTHSLPSQHSGSFGSRGTMDDTQIDQDWSNLGHARGLA